ncbi:hypothetical protein ZWY2020_039974 [Hordeum vulgare]|nr:hypothetical protein ZWY2020_039974 [Hordeum vulgare]
MATATPSGSDVAGGYGDLPGLGPDGHVGLAVDEGGSSSYHSSGDDEDLEEEEALSMEDRVKLAEIWVANPTSSHHWTSGAGGDLVGGQGPSAARLAGLPSEPRAASTIPVALGPVPGRPRPLTGDGRPPPPASSSLRPPRRPPPPEPYRPTVPALGRRLPRPRRCLRASPRPRARQPRAPPSPRHSLPPFAVPLGLPEPLDASPFVVPLGLPELLDASPFLASLSVC